MSGQVWAISEDGGYMYSDELSDVLRTSLQPIQKFRQFCDCDDATEKGLNAGDLYNWNVYSNTEDQGGAISELQEMPQTKFKVRQAQLVMTEYGNSVPYTGKLDNLSRHPVERVIHKVLKDDAKKALDGAAFIQFNLTGLTVQASAGTSTTAVVFEEGGCTITNNVALGKGHIKAIVDGMKERSIPPFEGDDYFALAWPATLRPFKNELEAIKQYVDLGFTQIRNGETGRYESTRFIEQNHVAKGGAVDSTTYDYLTADAWNNGLSDWMFIFGEDTVMEAIAIPEEIRGKIPTDYGRSRGVAWYYLGGFGIVHGPAMDQAQTRIVKWESAA